MAHQPAVAIIGQLIGMTAQEARNLGLHACTNNARAPARKTSVNGSENAPG
jgi:hypothetical protein